jgi:hypothetical protein
MKRLQTIALLAVAVAGISLTAQAQTTTPSTSANNRCTEFTARATSRLAYLQTKLAITSSQQSVWNAYASAVTAGAQTMSAVCLSLPSPRPSDAPSRFDNGLKIAAAKVQADQAVSPALHALYAALTPAQQALFDQRGGRHGGFRNH